MFRIRIDNFKDIFFVSRTSLAELSDELFTKKYVPLVIGFEVKSHDSFILLHYGFEWGRASAVINSLIGRLVIKLYA